MAKSFKKNAAHAHALGGRARRCRRARLRLAGDHKAWADDAGSGSRGPHRGSACRELLPDARAEKPRDAVDDFFGETESLGDVPAAEPRDRHGRKRCQAHRDLDDDAHWPAGHAAGLGAAGRPSAASGRLGAALGRAPGCAAECAEALGVWVATAPACTTWLPTAARVWYPRRHESQRFDGSKLSGPVERFARARARLSGLLLACALGGAGIACNRGSASPCGTRAAPEAVAPARPHLPPSTAGRRPAAPSHAGRRAGRRTRKRASSLTPARPRAPSARARPARRASCSPPRTVPQVNDKYPYKFKPRATPPGSSSRAKVVDTDAMTLEKKQGIMKVRLHARGARATHALSGTFSFSVCTDGSCLIEKRELSLDVTANSRLPPARGVAAPLAQA